MELPEIRAVVTEYHRLNYLCHTCGRESVADLPPGIPNSSFGSKLTAFVGYLTGALHIAKREVISLCKELFDIEIGLGSIPNIEERVAKALDQVCSRIHQFVIESSFCKHFDETGWRDSGKRHYVWLAACSEASYYMIDRNRSRKAFERLVGKDPSSLPSVTDRYGVYKKIKTHQYCLAHLIRECKRYAERDGPDKDFGLALKNQLKKACNIHATFRDGQISWIQRNRRLGHCRKKLIFHLEDAFANGSDDLYKLCDNLLEEFDHLWTFSKVRGMEPTNNLAERDLRKLVIWRKKSYGTKSERGKKYVERITTVVENLKKQGRHILSFIHEALIKHLRLEAPPFIAEAKGF